MVRRLAGRFDLEGHGERIVRTLRVRQTIVRSAGYRDARERHRRVRHDGRAVVMDDVRTVGVVRMQRFVVGDLADARVPIADEKSDRRERFPVLARRT